MRVHHRFGSSSKRSDMITIYYSKTHFIFGAPREREEIGKKGKKKNRMKDNLQRDMKNVHFEVKRQEYSALFAPR